MRTALILLMTPLMASAAVRDSVVWSGSCSGVIVRGNLMLTAEHCGHRTGTLFVNGRQTEYATIHEPAKNLIDECSILRLRGTFPSVAVAESPPRVGDRVYSWGYPSGKMTKVSGRVSRIDSMVHCDFQIWEGHSGGPLFNSRDEVIGLASTRNLRHQRPGSHWIPLTSIQTSLAKVAVKKKKPVVYLFTWNACAPCQQLKKHYARLRETMDLRVVEFDSREWHAALTLYRGKTNGGIIRKVPTFWVADTTKTMSGEKFVVAGPAINVVSIVTWVLKSAASLIVGRIRERRQDRDDRVEVPGGEEPPTPFRPIPQTEPLPTPVEPPDWSSVKVVLLLAKEDVGYIRGKAREKAIGLVTGPLRRRIDTTLGSSVGLAIVSERLNPTRYAAVLAAAKTSVDRFAIIAVVKKKDVGLAKGLRNKIALNIANGKLQNAPVDVIFERTHPADFQGVVDALGVVEPAAVVAPLPIPSGDSLLTLDGIKGVVSAAVAEKLKGKVFPKSEPVPVAKTNENEKGDPLQWPGLSGIVGMALTGALGYGVAAARKELANRKPTDDKKTGA